MVQLMSKLTLVYIEHTHVLQFLSKWFSQKLMCDMQWAARESSFVYCTRATYILCTACNTHVLCVLHNSNKRVSNALCAPHELVFLYTCCTQVNCHPLPEKNQDIQWNGTLAKYNKTCVHKENSILSSIYVLLFQSTPDDIVLNQLNAKHGNNTRFRQHEG